VEEPSGGVEWTVASIEGDHRARQQPAAITAQVNLIQEKPAREETL